MSTATVMVVEDDDDVREAIVFLLQCAGFHVVQASDGREALDYIGARGLPQLILLDMNMPIMDGWELARELRARKLTACPVVVVTAAHDAQQNAEEIGAAGFIGKPFDFDTLIRTVHHHAMAGSADMRP